MEEEKLDVNTSRSVIGTSGGSNGIIQPAANGNLQLVKSRTVDLEFVCAIILSLGLVAALLLFVHESFLYPSSATQLIPLIFGPVGTTIVGLLMQRQQKKNATSTIETALKIANTVPDQGRS